MKLVRKLTVALTVVLIFSAVSLGQVTAQLPSQTLVALRVKNIGDFSAKIATLGTQLSLTDQAPAMADVLGFVCKQAKIDEKALKKDGDFAVALINAGGQGFNGPTPPVVMLIPTTDYAAFLAGYPDAKTDGAVSSVTLPDGESAYLAKWGDYAALSPNKEIVALPPGGMVVSAAATKELDKDACILVNMSAVRAVALPVIMVSRQQIITQMDRGIRQSPMAKYAPILKIAVNEIMDFVQRTLADCDDVTYAVNITPDGIGTSLVVDFKSDSPFGQYVAATANTDKPLMAGLPTGKYLIFGGAIGDPKRATELMNTILDPLMPEIQNLGPDGKIFNDYIQSIKDIVAAQQSACFGFVAPEGELGTSPLMQFITLKVGDAKAIGAASSKLLQTQQDQFKAMGAGNPVPVQMSFTPAAKTIDGVQFDQFHTGFDIGAMQGPQMAQVGQIMSFIYGMDGLNIYSGVVNDTTYLQVGGLSDDKISAAVAAAKSGADVLSQQPGVVATTAHLPAQRLSVMFVPVDVIANTALGYIAKFGMDMGVTLPASDPIGMSLSTEASSFHAESFIPNKLMVGIADAAKKLMGKSHAPAAPGGGGGGGL